MLSATAHDRVFRVVEDTDCHRVDAMSDCDHEAADGSRHRMPARPRIRLKPAHHACGHVQGAWWPWSTELTTELTPLLSALWLRYGVVDSVHYHRGDWSAVGALSMIHAHRCVRLHADEATPHVVSLIGTDFGRLHLLVVPPYTDAEDAYQIVTTASLADNVATPDSLLRLGARASRARHDMRVAVQRWECEGGAYVAPGEPG